MYLLPQDWFMGLGDVSPHFPRIVTEGHCWEQKAAGSPESRPRKAAAAVAQSLPLGLAERGRVCRHQDSSIYRLHVLFLPHLPVTKKIEGNV